MPLTVFCHDEQSECDNNVKDDDDARPKRLLCMIPKKRYLYSKSTTIVMPQNAIDLGLIPPPLLLKQKYTEDDQDKKSDERNQQHQQSLSSPPSPRQQVTKSYSESPPSKHDASPPSFVNNHAQAQTSLYSENDVSIAMILANGFGKPNKKDWGKKDTASVVDEPERAEV